MFRLSLHVTLFYNAIVTNAQNESITTSELAKYQVR